MVNQEIVNYFNEGIKRGNSFSVLKNSLLEAGFAFGDVEDALNFVKAHSIENSIPSIDKSDSYFQSKEKNNSVEKKKRPLGVVIVSIIHWLIAATILFTLLLPGLFFSGFAGGIFGTQAILITIVIAVVISSIPIVVGIGIWEGRNFWRIVAIVFGFIFSIIGIYNLTVSSLSGILNLIVSVFVVLYLLISKDSKEFFKK